jgi:hypothetical protein
MKPYYWLQYLQETATGLYLIWIKSSLHIHPISLNLFQYYSAVYDCLPNGLFSLDYLPKIPSAGLVPPLSNLLSCTITSPNLYFTIWELRFSQQ